MRGRLAAFAVVLMFSVSGLWEAQSISADEKAIRDIIASGKQPTSAKDMIFWTGAFKRPVIGADAKREPVPGVANRVGPTKTTWTIRRIEVAQSGDMAYEFSDGAVTGEEKGPDGKVTANTFTNSVLRVWRKVGGQWQVAAHFARPHEE